MTVKIPSPKTQAPKNHQSSSSEPRVAGLGIEAWDFFGVWSLGFGFLMHVGFTDAVST
jgi:hypothetical protein